MTMSRDAHHSKLYDMIHITILIWYRYVNDIYHDTTGHKLIELRTEYQTFIIFLGIKWFQIVNFFPFFLFVYYLRPINFNYTKTTCKFNWKNQSLLGNNSAMLINIIKILKISFICHFNRDNNISFMIMIWSDTFNLIYNRYHERCILYTGLTLLYFMVVNLYVWTECMPEHLKGMEHVPNIFISFDKYLFLEVINILI